MSQLIFDRIVAAIEADDRAAFLRCADHDMRHAVTPELWREINKLAPHLNAGYKATHVRGGEEEGFDVNVWKLIFDDGSSHVMLRVVTRGDELAGLWRDIDAAGADKGPRLNTGSAGTPPTEGPPPAAARRPSAVGRADVPSAGPPPVGRRWRGMAMKVRSEHSAADDNQVELRADLDQGTA